MFGADEHFARNRNKLTGKRGGAKLNLSTICRLEMLCTTSSDFRATLFCKWRSYSCMHKCRSKALYEPVETPSNRSKNLGICKTSSKLHTSVMKLDPNRIHFAKHASLCLPPWNNFHRRRLLLHSQDALLFKRKLKTFQEDLISDRKFSTTIFGTNLFACITNLDMACKVTLLSNALQVQKERTGAA